MRGTRCLLSMAEDRVTQLHNDLPNVGLQGTASCADFFIYLFFSLSLSDAIAYVYEGRLYYERAFINLCDARVGCCDGKNKLNGYREIFKR